ncbi:hypothetical protein CVU82_01385 [Candidatus Falkowbacteria bacterium HGW-Falkowbacteria-1]|jgi:hypothetical protein|uniref:Uncharacterized protein n=1 Tax=Candidatus Falkowbacteria bacterium HGW-Falkowbacteria-1 TaxID=2013768 RepID=A0A2N2EAZ8_9BACT|nr:MAG: hypothetical protein CVU82_01385 [Candidatus Falkowbacteria bacterium HGW-Falkowbacteria-1]
MKSKIKNFFGRISVFFQFKTKERIKLEKLFDWQMEQLKEIGISKDIISRFREKKDEVLNHFLYFCSLPGYYEMTAFLPVIPLEILKRSFPFPLSTINKQELSSGSSRNLAESIDTEEVYDLRSDTEIPTPYFIFGLENGMNENSISSVSPSIAQDLFARTRLSPLNLSEALSMLIIFPGFYNGNGEKISIMGSRYRNEKVIPEFFRNGKGFQLSWAYDSNLGVEKVYPVCWERKFF